MSCPVLDQSDNILVVTVDLHEPPELEKHESNDIDQELKLTFDMIHSEDIRDHIDIAQISNSTLSATATGNELDQELHIEGTEEDQKTNESLKNTISNNRTKLNSKEAKWDRIYKSIFSSNSKSNEMTKARDSQQVEDIMPMEQMMPIQKRNSFFSLPVAYEDKETSKYNAHSDMPSSIKEEKEAVDQAIVAIEDTGKEVEQEEDDILIEAEFSEEYLRAEASEIMRGNFGILHYASLPNQE